MRAKRGATFWTPFFLKKRKSLSGPARALAQSRWCWFSSDQARAQKVGQELRATELGKCLRRKLRLAMGLKAVFASAAWEGCSEGRWCLKKGRQTLFTRGSNKFSGCPWHSISICNGFRGDVAKYSQCGPLLPRCLPFAKNYCQKVCFYINYNVFLHFRDAFGMHVAFHRAFAMHFEAMSPNIGNGALWGAFCRLRANMVCP